MPIDFTKHNPLGLKVLADIPETITKGQLAKAVMPEDLTFDYALPQEWLNQFSGDEYLMMVTSCVTAYPKGSVFGVIVNLFTGEVYQ